MSDAISAAAKRGLPKRFYKSASVKSASVDPTGDRFLILLDGRSVRTPGKAELAVPNAALAQAVAAEWDAQGTHIDPATMPLTRIANSTIDGVAGRRGEVEDEIARYAANDLVCYRAEGPDALVRQQAEAWDPVVAWAARDLGVTPNVGSGITHVMQPAGLQQAVKQLLGTTDPLALAALHVLTTLTGSALLSLALARAVIDADSLWKAAHIDEDFQIAQWGWDAEASARRAAREREMRAAASILTALAPPAA